MLEKFLKGRLTYRALLDARAEKIQRDEERKYHEKVLEVTRQLRDEYEIEIDNRDSEIHMLQREIKKLDKQIRDNDATRINAIRLTKKNRKLASDMLVEVRRVMERDADVLKAFGEIDDIAQRNELYMIQNKMEGHHD